MADIGNSNRISREYLDSLLIETRYMDSATPDISFELYGIKAASPIMTAALSHLDHFMFPGAADALAKGAKDAGAILWYGMAEEAEIERLRSVQSQKLSKEAQKLMSLPFRRAITKKEQADMGKLKKSVRGLVVVHPMTALGREMGLKEMTGFARSEF